VVLDKGDDPDTFIRKHGADRYRAKLRTSRPYLEYLRDQAAAGLDFGSPETQRRFLTEMLGVAAWLPDPALRDQFAALFGTNMRVDIVQESSLPRTPSGKFRYVESRVAQSVLEQLMGAGPHQDVSYT